MTSSMTGGARLRVLLFGLLSVFIALPAAAKLNVFACEPEWASLAEVIGGDHVSVFSATTAFQDPHVIQARPSLIAQMRRANVVICTGADLEIGWLPVLLRQAANSKVGVGTMGYFEASQFVRLRDASGSTDRADGDVHPMGNPHIQLDPRNILLVATALVERMQLLDGDNSQSYQANYESFAANWTSAITRWETAASSLKEMEIIVQHASWTYLEAWLGLIELAQMESKPGLPPTASHLARLLNIIDEREVKALIRSAYQSARASEWLVRRSDVPALVLPHTVGATPQAIDLFGLFDDIVRRLKEVNK